MTEEQLNLPSASIEFGEGIRGEELGIEQGGGEEDHACTETRDGHADLQNSDCNGIGDRLREPPRQLGRLIPHDQPVVLPEAPPPLRQSILRR